MDTAADDHVRRLRSARFATMPIVLAGTIAVTAGLTGPVAHAEPRHDDDGSNKRHVDQDGNVGHRSVFTTAVARPAQTVATTVASVSSAPTTYTVQQGDTVSAIAARHGLSAQEVLVRNGLGWNTIIHPGQVLHLASTPVVTTVRSAPATSTKYHVKSGDTISGIAARTGVSTSALLGANNLTLSSVIYPGQSLTVPKAGAAPVAPARTTSAPATSSAPAASTATAGSVTITAGQTIATIAAAHHVSVSALLSANGLTYTSTIYAGKTLVLPAAGPAAASGTALTAEQRANAETIVRVGRSLGVPQRGLVIALSAAMQESSLRNLPHGDRDSVGLFQQRPSQGWGTASQLQDTTYATKLFFGGRSNPNAGTTRGLLDVPGWSSKSVTDAAQAVQMSAYPKAYAQWERSATAWLATL
ncbi:LysM peptidoglycan-binding domain-containing protein [Microbacterium sp. M1A1_1b]